MPPSAYILAMALAIALAPWRLGFGDRGVPPRSGGLVIKNIFNRSKGAVHVRDTRKNDVDLRPSYQSALLTGTGNPTSRKEFNS
jgi:hypothetical protein